MPSNTTLRVAVVRNGGLMRQHHLTTLCGFLHEQGIGVEFISLQAPAHEVEWFAGRVPGITVQGIAESCGAGFQRFFKGGLALRWRLRKLQFDVLYVIDSWTLPYVFVATFGSMRWKACPMVYHTFDMLVPHVALRAYLWLERYAARRSDLNVNADRSRAAVTKALFGLRETPLAVPLRLPRNACLPARDDKRRASLIGATISQDARLIAYPSYAYEDRLTKELIRAVALLPDNYFLATIGGDCEYARECEELSRALGIADRVRFLSPMPHEEVLSYCACADVGVIFHDEEASLGNFLCHPGRLAYFIALGLPVVANAVPVLEAIVYRYGLGVCCSPREPEAVAGAIREICEGRIPVSERRRMIREHFQQDLHYELEGQKIVRALRRLTAAGRPAHGPARAL